MICSTWVKNNIGHTIQLFIEIVSASSRSEEVLILLIFILICALYISIYNVAFVFFVFFANQKTKSLEEKVMHCGRSCSTFILFWLEYFLLLQKYCIQ